MIILKMPNGRYFLPVPRSGSHCIARAAMKSFHSEVEIGEEIHPAVSYPEREQYDGSQESVAVLVRNPIERFRSTLAQTKIPFEKQIISPVYGYVPKGNFQYFLFETQLQECADWLGITEPLVQEAESQEKPEFTEYQESLVRSLFRKDIELWEFLGGA